MPDETKQLAFDMTVWIVSLFAILVLMAHEAMADSTRAPAGNDRWAAECGSCHMAYPPRFLPASAWRGIMQGLGTHFGVDASLDPAAAAEIGAFLEQHAGRNRRPQGHGEPPRITETAWFRHEHGKVPDAAWKHPDVKSAANCVACHTAADRGDFRERNIRIPR